MKPKNLILNYKKVFYFFLFLIPLIVFILPPQPLNLFETSKKYQCVIQLNNGYYFLKSDSLTFKTEESEEIKLFKGDSMCTDGYYILPKRIGNPSLLVNLKFIGLLRIDNTDNYMPNFDIVKWETESYIPYVLVADYNKIFSIFCLILIGIVEFFRADKFFIEEDIPLSELG